MSSAVGELVCRCCLRLKLRGGNEVEDVGMKALK